MATMLMQTVNNMLIEMYATLAHAEMQKREGIQAMKDRGEWNRYGRPDDIDYDVFRLEYDKVLAGEQRPFECIQKLKLSKATYYRYREKYEKFLESKK